MSMKSGKVAGHGLELGEVGGFTCGLVELRLGVVVLDEVVQRVAYAEVGGDDWRDCIQPKTQGMARRSSMLRFLALLASVRLAGREPMRACSSSATGVACSK